MSMHKALDLRDHVDGFSRKEGRRGFVSIQVSVDDIGQNIEKSPGNLRKLASTQTSERNYQPNLVWKNWKVLR